MKSLLAVFLLLSFVLNANAEVVFDNGGVLTSTTDTPNDTYPYYYGFDDFTLATDTTITGLTHSIFTTNEANYTETYLSIWDGIGSGATEIVANFSVVGSLTSNGLTRTNSNVPNGFDVDISNLAIDLTAGTYYIGISTGVVNGFASIGYGNGGVDTVGAGLCQVYQYQVSSYDFCKTLDSRRNMSFQLHSDVTSVPEASSVFLLAFGLLGLIGAARRKV